MCTHCDTDMTKAVYTDKAFHDGWLFPHGRLGYSGVTAEAIAAAKANCQFCPSGPFTGPAALSTQEH